MDQKKITIDDIAKALGVSKTTVSRAISGKGRIGEETKQKVNEYIAKYNYRPNVIAKSLAQSKTYNIGVVMPGDSNLMDLPFFQRCLIGITQIASTLEYDVLVSIVTADDISQLERSIVDNKVDGIILTRSLIDDKAAAYLKEKSIPFVVIGSSSDLEIVQIDNDHYNACKELTSTLLTKGMHRIALVGGNSNSVVDEKRYNGYKNAHKDCKVKINRDLIYMDVPNSLVLERVINEILQKKVDCVIGMDDYICNGIVNILRQKNISIPNDIRIASFYNSSLLENSIPAITSIHFDVQELGMATCKMLMEQMEGNEVPRKTRLGYEISLRESTKFS